MPTTRRIDVAGIGLRYALALVRAAMPVEIPPWDAVHDEGDHRVGAQQRPDAGRDRG